jgi:hypothetical protein
MQEIWFRWFLQEWIYERETEIPMQILGYESKGRRLA